MENPATWTDAERIVSKAYGDWADEKGRLMAAHASGKDADPPIIGLSLARRITDALRDAGLLAEHQAVDLRSAHLDELVAHAVDLMSYREMPDDGSLRELAVIVREAYSLGWESREATQ